MEDENLKRAWELNKKLSREIEEKRREQLHNEILSNLQKDFMTLGIGIISLCEEYFGDLWAHKQPRDKTDNEAEWFEDWQNLRTDILDKVHDLVRKNYKIFNNVEMNRKNYTLKGRMKNDN